MYLFNSIVPCHASIDVSRLPFFLSAALRLQLHSETMRLQARLTERKKYGATSRHLTHDRTLVCRIENLFLCHVKTLQKSLSSL